MPNRPPRGRKPSIDGSVLIVAKAASVAVAVVADDVSDANIRPEHLILGVLVKSSGDAIVVLRDAGVQISAIRKFLSGHEEQ